MKVGKNKQNIFIFFLGYLLELILKKSGDSKFLKKNQNQNLADLGCFCHWKILCIGRNHIFEAKI
jgi:hypothetical protein